MKLSILVPAYNESRTIGAMLDKLQKIQIPIAKEIVAVDDGSTDDTWALLKQRENPEMIVLQHNFNQGKGAALRTAMTRASGDILLIQDADLEYDPSDLPALLAPLLDNRADVVYGSRFLGGPHRVLLFWHYLGNLFFTLITNILYNVNLTDMGVGYKAFRKDALTGIVLRSNRFGFEPEITAKICKRHLRLYEVPISYSGRTYAEGKKITWRDGFAYLGCLLRYRLLD